MGTGCPRGTRPCSQGRVCYTFCGRRGRKGCRLLVAASLSAPRGADGICPRTGENRLLAARGRVGIIREAAEYFHIGEKKLRQIVEENYDADFLIMNGNRVMVKKKCFERYLDQATAV